MHLNLGAHRSMIGLFALLSACASTRSGTPGPSEATGVDNPHIGARHGQRGYDLGLAQRIFDGTSGSTVSEARALEDLIGARVIYVAENHDNPHHHHLQLALIGKLYHRDTNLAIGLEMFEQSAQASLDEYIEGSIDEAELLERTKYGERWGFDFALYRPILGFARAHGIRLIALNAADGVTSKVAKGGVGALSDQERAKLPALDLSDERYRSYVKEAFEGHEIEAEAFERFFAAQVIWDETMAERIARALTSEGAPARIVVLAGEGHVHGGFGIPARVARRGIESQKTVVPILASDEVPSRAELLADAAADLVWVMAGAEENLP